MTRTHHDLDLRGLPMPALGFGTWQLQGDEAYRAVREALDEGYRHIDTAKLYDNEEAVGRAIRDADVPRDEIFVTTKVWWTDLAPADLPRATEASLERLGLDHVDLLLVHWPETDDMPATLDALTAQQTGGRTRRIGVSNFTPAQLDEAVRRAPIANLQVEWHPYLSQEALHARCRAHDLVMTAYCPLGRGEVLDDPVLARIGEDHGVSPAVISLAWLLGHEGASVIPKASSAAHRRDNLRALDITLSEAERAEIADLDHARRIIDPAFAPRWAPRPEAAAP